MTSLFCVEKDVGRTSPSAIYLGLLNFYKTTFFSARETFISKTVRKIGVKKFGSLFLWLELLVHDESFVVCLANKLTISIKLLHIAGICIYEDCSCFV